MFFASVILLIFVYHIIYAEFDHVMILFSCCLGQVSLVKAILTIMGLPGKIKVRLCSLIGVYMAAWEYWWIFSRAREYFVHVKAVTVSVPMVSNGPRYT